MDCQTDIHYKNNEFGIPKLTIKNTQKLHYGFLHVYVVSCVYCSL